MRRSCIGAPPRFEKIEIGMGKIMIKPSTLAQALCLTLALPGLAQADYQLGESIFLCQYQQRHHQ